MALEPFSKRHGYRPALPEQLVYEDAPESIRAAVLGIVRELDWGPNATREVVCRALGVRPDPGNWSRENVWNEVQALVYGSDWYRFYDIVERLHAAMAKKDLEHGLRGLDFADASNFTSEVNQAMVDQGIGWQLVDGALVMRGTESFEAAVLGASAALTGSDRPTAAKHIHESLQALSRRPEPDISGAIYHAMGALEAVARDVVGDEKATLGEILKHHPDLLPAPLDRALSQVWGYASNVARHVAEGREPSREDAELVVGLAAAVATYVTKRHGA